MASRTDAEKEPRYRMTITLNNGMIFQPIVTQWYQKWFVNRIKTDTGIDIDDYFIPRESIRHVRFELLEES